MHLRDDLGLSRVAVHTRDYILSVMKGLIAPEDEVRSLTRGADAAAALAASGSIDGQLPKEVNPAGLMARDEFCMQGLHPSGRGAYTGFGWSRSVSGAFPFGQSSPNSRLVWETLPLRRPFTRRSSP